MESNFITRILVALDKRSHCTNKQKYGHRETAEKAVEAMAKKGANNLESYECAYCGKWHIGHSPETEFDCHLDRYDHCDKAGSTECDLECPFRCRVRPSAK